MGTQSLDDPVDAVIHDAAETTDAEDNFNRALRHLSDDMRQHHEAMEELHDEPVKGEGSKSLHAWSFPGIACNGIWAMSRSNPNLPSRTVLEEAGKLCAEHVIALGLHGELSHAMNSK